MEKKKKRKRTKKPKVTLNRRQVIILTAAIVSVCVCMLCVTILTLPSSNDAVVAVDDTSTAVPDAEVDVVSPYVPHSEETLPATPKEPQAKVPVDKPTDVGPDVSGGTGVPDYDMADEMVAIAPKNEQSVLPPSMDTTPAATLHEEPPPKPESPFASVPPAKDNAVLVLVLDDGGQNLEHLQCFLELPFPLSVAVLPKLQHSVETANRVRAYGKELMLHQPMQALNLNVNPGPGAITPDMHTYDIEALVRENIAEIAPVAGMNNHEGSLITESASKIGAVLDVCSEEGIFFLDSRTTASTKTPQAALERGIHIWERDVFLDNTQSQDDMAVQIAQAARIANRDGYAIMIGHVWSANNLAEVLLQMYRELSTKGYRFSTVGGLYEDFGN